MSRAISFYRGFAFKDRVPKPKDKTKTPSSYSAEGSQIPHRVTRISRNSGVPEYLPSQGTPVQPIVIRVPDNARRASGMEMWYLVAAVAAATLVSGTLSLYIASARAEDQKLKIDRLELEVDSIDQVQRKLESRLTKLETQQENGG